jgi:hypothetical protein
LNRGAKNRGNRKKNKVSYEQIFRNIMGRKMNKSERQYLGLKAASQGARRNSGKKR